MTADGCTPAALDLVRASGVQDTLANVPSSQVITPGPADPNAWEPIVIDLKQPNNGLSNAAHWIVDWISFIGICTQQAPAAYPVSGFFLCPQNTPAETLATAQAGLNLDARPITIPLIDVSINAPNIVGVGYIVAITARLGRRLVVPSGYFLRTIISCVPNNPQPGPGPLSVGRMRAGTFAELHV
jgi:hypothetical protein